MVCGFGGVASGLLLCLCEVGGGRLVRCLRMLKGFFSNLIRSTQVLETGKSND